MADDGSTVLEAVYSGMTIGRPPVVQEGRSPVPRGGRMAGVEMPRQRTPNDDIDCTSWIILQLFSNRTWRIG
ncbi:MAG: hypothetical protein AB7N61_27565 [Acidimicrobiia bacterium]